MHRLTLNISDSVFQKLQDYLNKFSVNEIQIIDDKLVEKDETDFIAYIVNNPIPLKKGTAFLSREDANVR